MNDLTDMNIRTIIKGIGHYTPPRVVTNFDLEKLMNTSDEWIRQRSGIVERRHVEPGVGSSDLAVEAAKLAVADAGYQPRDIDFVVAATLSPDHYFPGIGVMVQAGLDMGTAGALDVRNQCCGFIYGLSVADQFIKAGTYKRILLVAAEVQSSNLDYSDAGRDMAVLFGDGAGAVVLEADESSGGRGILSTHLFSDGRYLSDLWMEKPSCKDNPLHQSGFPERKEILSPHGREKCLQERLPANAGIGSGRPFGTTAFPSPTSTFSYPIRPMTGSPRWSPALSKFRRKKSSGTSINTGTPLQRPFP